MALCSTSPRGRSTMSNFTPCASSSCHFSVSMESLAPLSGTKYFCISTMLLNRTDGSCSHKTAPWLKNRANQAVLLRGVPMMQNGGTLIAARSHSRRRRSTKKYNEIPRTSPQCCRIALQRSLEPEYLHCSLRNRPARVHHVRIISAECIDLTSRRRIHIQGTARRSVHHDQEVPIPQRCRHHYTLATAIDKVQYRCKFRCRSLTSPCVLHSGIIECWYTIATAGAGEERLQRPVPHDGHSFAIIILDQR